MSERPNFLYLITDQQRSDWLSCYGHPVVKTPHIDSLARTGSRFTDFHVASPVCMPNRASLMTGRMPTLHGLRYNGCHLPPTANTFVEVLRQSGYRTAAMGKSHLQPFTNEAARHLPDPPGLENRIVEEAWQQNSDASIEDTANYDNDEPFQVQTPYFGFEHMELSSHHGDQCGAHYRQWFRAQRKDWQALWDEQNEIPHNYSCPQAYRTPVPEELYPSSWIADRAIDYLDNQKQSDSPFFAFVSFPDPHHPFNPPGKYWDMYSPEDFDISLPFDAHQNPPPPLQWMEQNFREGGKQFTKQTAMRVGDQQLREAMALTAGMITMIDDQIGRIIDTLKANGQYDNTVIIFNSDHGDYMGDFGLLLKGSLPFRSITQVPMIWSDPANRNEQTVDALASTIDIAPSILERAGLTPYRGVQGQSFIESFNNNTHRDELLIEFNDGSAKLGFESPARVRTLRTKSWRFSMYAGEDWGELYNLKTDPNESHNLWDSDEHRGIRGDLAMRLNHHLTQQMDESPRSVRIA